jgi:transposase
MHRRRVLDKSITYVGLDVHKDTIAVALAEAGAHKDVREYGKVANTATALNALAAKLSRAGSELRFCYEAGPCGYGIQRQLSLAGHGCVVVAPSLIPRKPGDRIKTDRRDAINLAKLHRAGELTAVWIPDQAHEAIRDLVRARLAAVRSLRQARQQLSGFLLRHGRHYNRPAWTLMHRRWMAGLKFEQAAHHIVLEDCIAAVEAATARRDRLEAHIEAALPDWSLAPVVRALQALRGMAMVAAATVIAELGDITRFANPRQLMAISRTGSVRALQRRHTPPRRHYESREWRGAANANRGCLELSVPGAHQPRATATSGGSGQADPRHRVEGPRAVVSALSQARPGGKITHSGHDRDRSRTGGFCLGGRQTRSNRQRLMR